MSRKQPGQVMQIRLLIVSLIDIMKDNGIPVERAMIYVRDEEGNFIGEPQPVLKMANDALVYLESIDPQKNEIVSTGPEESTNEQESPTRYI